MSRFQQLAAVFGILLVLCLGLTTMAAQATGILTAVNLTAAPVTPQPIKTPITLTATPTGGSNVEYKFRAGYQDTVGWHWTELNAYSTSNTLRWAPVDVHIYTLIVWAREVGSKKGYDVTGTLSYRITPQLSAVSLTAVPATPTITHATVALTATPTGGGTVEYKFRVGYQDASGWHWTDIQGYNVSRTANWTPLDARLYTLVIWAREVGSTKSYDVSGTLTYRVNVPPLTAVSLTAAPPSICPVNTPVTLTATPTGGNSVEYRFRAGYQDTTGWHWSDLSAYTTTRTLSWTPTSIRTYTLAVWAREVGHTTNYDKAASATYRVTPVPITGVSIYAAPTTPQMAGSLVSLTTTVNGGTNVEYKFRAGYQDTAGWHWADLCAYGHANSNLWTPTVARTYTLAVWAREVGNPAAYQAVGTTVYQVTPLVVNVLIHPTAITMNASTMEQFEAMVTGAPDQRVTWSVQEGNAGGTIDNAGNYTAPETPGTYHVRATSVAYPNKSATVTVTVRAETTVTLTLKWPSGQGNAQPVVITGMLYGVDWYFNLLSSVELRPGDTTQLTFTHVPVGAVDLTVSSSQGDTVVGEAKIRAVTQAGHPLAFTVNLASAVDHLAINPEQATRNAGDTLTFIATPINAAGEVVLTPANALGWTSSAPTVATIEAVTGEANCLSDGDTTVQATDSASGATVTAALHVNGPTLTQPVEIPSAPSSIGGTLYTLATRPGTTNILLDTAYNGQVSLTGTTTNGAGYTAQTYSTIQGSYSFANVPAGTYTVSAGVHAPWDANVTLSGQITGIRTRGNIPTLMANVILGDSANTATVTGVVTRNNPLAPVSGATVVLSIVAYYPSEPQGPSTAPAIYTSTTTDANGVYMLQVPAGAHAYYLDAFTDATLQTDGAMIEIPLPNTTSIYNLALQDATEPIFPRVYLTTVSTTLPAPTAHAAAQAQLVRRAIARSFTGGNNGAKLPQWWQAQPLASNTASGIIENDLYWFLLSDDPNNMIGSGVTGFNVYRASAPTNPFTWIGSADDTYRQTFYDNTPALQDMGARYYTVTCTAANGRHSAPAVAVTAQPLPQLTGLRPAANATVSRQTGAFTWNAVPGATSYALVLFTEEPTYNALTLDTVNLNSGLNTIEPMADIPPGDYWWCVVAVKESLPFISDSVSFSAINKVTVTE